MYAPIDSTANLNGIYSNAFTGIRDYNISLSGVEFRNFDLYEYNILSRHRRFNISEATGNVLTVFELIGRHPIAFTFLSGPVLLSSPDQGFLLSIVVNYDIEVSFCRVAFVSYEDNYEYEEFKFFRDAGSFISFVGSFLVSIV